jgi:hypothetical protein
MPYTLNVANTISHGAVVTDNSINRQTAKHIKQDMYMYIFSYIVHCFKFISKFRCCWFYLKENVTCQHVYGTLIFKEYIQIKHIHSMKNMIFPIYMATFWSDGMYFGLVIQ